MTTPEARYSTAQPEERERLQIEVLGRYRARIAGVVRALTTPPNWAEGEQVGAIGLLVALERYDSARLGEDRGGAFWFFAQAYVRDEVQSWLDHGVLWRPRRQRKPSAGAPRRFESLEALTVEIACARENAEDLFAKAEGVALVQKFVSSLDSADAHLLTCEKRERGDPTSPRAQRYGDLFRRLIQYVRGDEVQS